MEITINISVEELKELIGNRKDQHAFSEYARIFDCECEHWTHSRRANYEFLKRCEVDANNELERRGYLLLNDVYRMLGIARNLRGYSAGWIYGDGSVKFRHEDLLNGGIVVDFNVRDDIWDVFGLRRA